MAMPVDGGWVNVHRWSVSIPSRLFSRRYVSCISMSYVCVLASARLHCAYILGLRICHLPSTCCKRGSVSPVTKRSLTRRTLIFMGTRSIENSTHKLSIFVQASGSAVVPFIYLLQYTSVVPGNKSVGVASSVQCPR